jgi:proteasome assembly chaperone (PAC2) family protein
MRFRGFDLNEPVPELRSPHAFACLRPWVDVGSVGSLTFRSLERHLAAEDLGQLARPGIFFDFTRYRPTIYTDAEGDRKVVVPNVSVKYARGPGENDLVFLHLLEPHLNGEGFVSSIVKLLEKLGVERYCLIGGMYDLVPHTKPIMVTGTATGDMTLKEVKGLDIKASTYEGPTSIAAMVSQEASKVGIETMGMIAHLPQYAQLERDHTGRLSLLEIICQLYDIDMDLDRIRQRAKRQYDEVTAAMNRSPEVQGLVQRLESEYEDRVGNSDKNKDESTQLAPEVEDFLKKMGEQFNQG